MIQGKLIVSCQASEGDAFRDSGVMARFARAAVEAGAAGIRADGVDDIRAIRAAVDVPILGIGKHLASDGKILITPSFEIARGLVAAGADMIALDMTARGREYGALDRLRRIKDELRVPVLADVATVEEGVEAARAGADFVLSTLRGYTPDTAGVKCFEPEFVAELVRATGVPVIAEGRIWTPREACQALEAGAVAVVVGTAITRPRDIARRFADALKRHAAAQSAVYAGVDLGGTNTKFGLVSGAGKLLWEGVAATPAAAGRAALLDHLKAVARRTLEQAARMELEPAALGIATAGWVDPGQGVVVYATDNLPGWTGTALAQELGDEVNLPVAVENDANALAVAEHHFGCARGLDDFIAVTLGTGVGGGCYVGGRLNHGAHFFANALGHVPIEPDGLPCTCGLRGCLEAYANSAALMRYAGEGGYATAEEVIRAAHAGEGVARGALRTYARALAAGCATFVHLYDPRAIVFSGGLAQNNPLLLEYLGGELAGRVTVWQHRNLKLLVSPLGYTGGVLGAAAVAKERIA